MRKNNKFDKVFLVGLIPLSLLCLILTMIGMGIFYAYYKPKSEDKSIPPTSSEHICPKGEKIYIHDTVYIKVPQLCNKPHTQPEEVKPPGSDPQDAINDTNGTVNKEN